MHNGQGTAKSFSKLQDSSPRRQTHCYLPKELHKRSYHYTEKRYMTCVTAAGEFFLVCVSGLAGLGNRSASSRDSTSVIIGMDNFSGNSGVLADTPVNQHTISVKRCGCNLLLLCIIMYWVGIITHFSDTLALLIIKKGKFSVFGIGCWSRPVWMVIHRVWTHCYSKNGPSIAHC